MWALYAREVKRFQKLWIDTVFTPIVTVVLYLAVFGVLVGDQTVGSVSFPAFVYSGLMAMTLVNSSFANPAFALIIAKNVGTIIDLQLVPIHPWRIGASYAFAALTRGFLTILGATLLTGWFVPGLGLAHPIVLLVSLVVTGMQFGLMGVAFGMWVKNFEAMTFVQTFVMQPMIFLAGVFYPISTLSEPWHTLSLFNPMHHNVNLIRFGFTGYSDISPWISFGVAVCLSFVLLFVMTRIVHKTLSN